MRPRSSIALSLASLATALVVAALVRAGRDRGSVGLRPGEEVRLAAHGDVAPVAAERSPERAGEPLDCGASRTAIEVVPAVGAMEAPPDDALTIRGRVFDATTREPIAVAWVEADRRGRDAREAVRVACDETGAFELAAARELLVETPRFEGDPASRPVSLRAGGAGHSARSFGFALERGSNAIELALPLARGIALRGEVLDLESGAPIAGARVTTSILFSSDETTTDGRGAFELRVGDEAVSLSTSVTADAPGWCGASRRIELGGDTNERSATIHLLRATWIEGRVVDASGVAVEGAVISFPASQTGARIEDEWAGELRARGVDVARLEGLIAHGSDREVQSGADGGFCSNELAPWQRDVAVRATLADGRSASARIERLGAPGETTRVELVLGSHPGCAEVHGRLLLNGEPVRGEITGFAEGGLFRTLAGEDGRYALAGLPPGRVHLLSHPDAATSPFDLPNGAVELELAPGESREQDFALELRRGRIAGRATRADGTPAARVLVGARNNALGLGTMPVETGADGRYELALPDDRAEFEVVASWASDSLSVLGVKNGDEHADLDLPPAGLLRLASIDASTGLPLAPAFDVEFQKCGERDFRRAQRPGWSENAPDEQGRMTYHLPAGRVDLVVRAARMGGYLPQRVDGLEIPDSDVPLDLEVRMERGLDVEFRLAEDAEVPPGALTILALEAELADSVRFELEDRRPRWSGHPLLGGDSLRSDRGLRFSRLARRALLRGLPAGRYVLRAFPDEIELEPSSFELHPGERATIELRWKPRTE